MLRPTQNLKATFEQTSRELTLSAPHCQILFEVDEENMERATQSAEEINLGLATENVQWVLEAASAYPISVQLARREVTGVDVSSFTSSQNSYLGTWNTDPIVEQSRIPGQSGFSDPLAAHSLICEVVLQHSFTNADQLSQTQLLDQLRQQNEERFFEVMTVFLTQTFYVTSNCTRALAPSLRLPEPLAKFMANFIEMELGHEKYIAQSLRQMGCEKPDLSLVRYETKALMNLLEHTASSNPLALCVLLTFFEGRHYDEIDPIAQLLMKSTKPKSADGIQKHWEINKFGDHASIGEELAKLLGPVSPDTVRSATQIAEAAHGFLKSSTSDFIELCENSII